MPDKIGEKMFKKLIISAALVAGATSIGTVSVQAMPLCQGNPGQCLQKMPNIPINPVIVKPIKYKPVPIIPITPLPIGPAPAPSGPSFGINVNLGGDGYAGGPDYVSCYDAKSIVRHQGYRHVHTQSCGDGDYTFFATRHGTPFVVQVSDSGEIVNADIAD
jgi:hypothetical protein